jgi:hypothetical protein
MTIIYIVHEFEVKVVVTHAIDGKLELFHA